MGKYTLYRVSQQVEVSTEQQYSKAHMSPKPKFT